MKINIKPFEENLIYHVIANLAVNSQLCEEHVPLKDRVGIVICSAIEARMVISEVAKQGPQAFSEYALSDVKNGCVVVAGMIAVAIHKYLGISKDISKDEYIRRYDVLREKSLEVASREGGVRPTHTAMLMAIKHGHSDHDMFTGEYRETSASTASVMSVYMHSKRLKEYFNSHEEDEIWSNSQSLGAMVCASMEAYVDVCASKGESWGEALMFDAADMKATQPAKLMFANLTIH